MFMDGLPVARLLQHAQSSLAPVLIECGGVVVKYDTSTFRRNRNAMNCKKAALNGAKRMASRTRQCSTHNPAVPIRLCGALMARACRHDRENFLLKTNELLQMTPARRPAGGSQSAHESASKGSFRKQLGFVIPAEQLFHLIWVRFQHESYRAPLLRKMCENQLSKFLVFFASSTLRVA
jgi:hypothetical protein